MRLVLGILFLGILVLGVSGYFLYPFEFSSDKGVPIIQADKSPYKEKPKDPGGIKIPYQNIEVFERLTSRKSQNVPVEQLLPQAEKPEQVKVILEQKKDEVAEPQNVNKDAIVSHKTEVEKTEKINNDAVDIKKIPDVEESKPIEVSKPTPEKQDKIAELVNDLSNPAIKKIKLQIFSTKNKQAAEIEKAKFEKKFAKELKGLKTALNRVDLGDKGIYYRLQVGHFKTPNSAENFCILVTDKKTGCFYIKEK